jgi:MFS family permease
MAAGTKGNWRPLRMLWVGEGPERFRSRPVAREARLALGLLLLVYAFNFIDRIVLGILVPPIKADLDLTDTELGLLGGTAFALFYTALGVPIGWLADRFNRVWIMTISLALWSAFAAASGLAQNFLQLFIARLGVGVGVGEAGGVVPAYSMLAYFTSSASTTGTCWWQAPTAPVISFSPCPWLQAV